MIVAVAEIAEDVADHAMIAADLGEIVAEAAGALDFVPIVVPVAVKDAMVSVAAAEHLAPAEHLAVMVIDAREVETAAEVVENDVVEVIDLSEAATRDRRRIAHARMSYRQASRQRWNPPAQPFRALPSISGSPGGYFLFPIWRKSSCKAGIVISSSSKPRKASRCSAVRWMVRSG